MGFPILARPLLPPLSKWFISLFSSLQLLTFSDFGIFLSLSKFLYILKYICVFSPAAQQKASPLSLLQMKLSIKCSYPSAILTMASLDMVEYRHMTTIALVVCCTCLSIFLLFCFCLFVIIVCWFVCFSMDDCNIFAICMIYISRVMMCWWCCDTVALGWTEMKKVFLQPVSW